MGQSPSTLLASLESSSDADTDTDARLATSDALTSLSLLAELKQAHFFGDVHYESSIEGDVLLPLDKVVTKGGKTFCNVSTDAGAVGGEVREAVGGVVRAGVVDAVTTTIAQVLAEAMAEAGDSSTARTFAERRHFSIVVGHLGGIYRLNYLLFTLTHRSPALRAACPTYLVAAWALSSVRLDWLALNAVNIAIEQSFRHAEGEGHEEFRRRVDGIKALALQDWDDDQVREAAIERRKRRAEREDRAGEA